MGVGKQGMDGEEELAVRQLSDVEHIRRMDSRSTTMTTTTSTTRLPAPVPPAPQPTVTSSTTATTASFGTNNYSTTTYGITIAVARPQPIPPFSASQRQSANLMQLPHLYHDSDPQRISAKAEGRYSQRGLPKYSQEQRGKEVPVRQVQLGVH